MTSSVQTLKLAVCLFDDVAFLDFSGPMESIGFLAPWNVLNAGLTHVDSKVAIEAVYLGPSEAPVKPTTGPAMVPTKTYDDVRDDEQFDIIIVPGGL